MTHEREIVAPVDLCRGGALAPEAVGWARAPLVRGNLVGPWGRKKRWHYWCLVTPTHVVSVTVADIDYLAFVAVWLIELGAERAVFETVAPLLPGVHLPDSPIGDLRARGPGMNVALVETPGTTRLTLDARIPFGKRLELDARIARPRRHETLDVVVPFPRGRFHLTSKHVGLPVTGEARCAGRDIPLDGWGCLDWGRGVVPYRAAWNWAVGARPGLAFNLGGRWTRDTGVTENALFLDGRLHKLGEELDWETADRSTWRIAGRQVELAFARQQRRRLCIELGIAGVRLDLAWGRFSGQVTGDDGMSHDVDLFGWAEAVDARW